MLISIAFGLPIMAVCLFLEALLLLLALRFYIRRESMLTTPSFWPAVCLVSGVMTILVMGNVIQIGIWALLFQLIGEFPEYSTAFYHSAVNFATLGYGDIVMSDEYRLLGPLEAINGVLMIGVSTAVLMAIFTKAIRKTVKARQEAGVGESIRESDSNAE